VVSIVYDYNMIMPICGTMLIEKARVVCKNEALGGVSLFQQLANQVQDLTD
jgi:hypothetical protein